MESPDEPDERRCHSCGEWLEPADRYCPSCGTRVDDTDSAHQPAPGQHDTGHVDRATGAVEPAPPQESKSEKTGPGKPGSRVGQESPVWTVVVGILLAALGIIFPVIVLTPIGLFVTPLLQLPELVILPIILILQFFLFVVVAMGYLRWRGYTWSGVKSYLGVETPSVRDIGLILATWFVMIVVTLIVANIIVWALPEVLGTEQTEPASNPVSEIIEENPEIVLGAVAFMFLVVGPAEEILFRGVVQNRLREGLSKIPAILVASALFASVHIIALLGQDPIAIAQTITILFIPSLGLGFIYEYTGNIVVPALLHGFHNSMLVLITAIGAIYGPEQAVVTPPLVADLLAAIL